MKSFFISSFVLLLVLNPVYADAQENFSSEEQSLIDAFSDAPRKNRANITILGEDPTEEEGIDLKKDAREKAAKSSRREKAKKEAQKAEEAAYKKKIMENMLQDEKDRQDQEAMSQKKLLDEQKEAEALKKDAIEQRKNLFTGKELQEKLNKTNAKFKAEKRKLDVEITRKKKAEMAAHKRKEQTDAKKQTQKQKANASPCKNNFTMQRLDKFICNCPGYAFDIQSASCIPGKQSGIKTAKDAELVQDKGQIVPAPIIKKKSFIDDFTKGQDLVAPPKKVFIDDFTKGQDLVAPQKKKIFIDDFTKTPHNTPRQQEVDRDLKVINGGNWGQ